VRRVALLALTLAGCATLPSEAQRTALLKRLDNIEHEAESPGPRSAEHLAALRAEYAADRASVNSVCLGEPVKW
jgi:hypothetical protein